MAALQSVANPDRALPGACRWGDPEIVAWLLSSGADPNSQSLDGTPCLVLAAARDRTLTMYSENEQEQTPQDLVAQDLIGRLLQAGATLSPANPEVLLAACRAGHAQTAKYLLERGVDPRTAGKNGAYALLLAAQTGNLELLTSLLAHGADPRVRDRHGMDAEQHLLARMSFLQYRMERLSRMRSYQPGAARAQAELERLQAVREPMRRLLQSARSQ